MEEKVRFKFWEDKKRDRGENDCRKRRKEVYLIRIGAVSAFSALI